MANKSLKKPEKKKKKVNNATVHPTTATETPVVKRFKNREQYFC